MAEEQQTNEQGKELLKGINPEELAPELQTVYKSMLADYTRKTQEVASKSKEWQTEREQYLDKIRQQGALEQEVTQWRDWYRNLEEQVNKEDDPMASHTGVQSRSTSDTADTSENTRKLEQELLAIKNELGSHAKALRETSTRTDRMFNYQAQLSELSGRYGAFDKSKLLQHALETGQVDLDKAYKDLNREEIIQREVDAKVKEEMAKMRTDGLHHGTRQIIFRGSGKPKTFAEATEQVLQQKAREGTLE
jgi:hypothetical protein